MPHDHGHIDASAGDRRVAIAVIINLALTVAQIIGGLISGSVALIADALHNLSDAMSLVIAFAARRIARRPSDNSMTFGYRRAETVAALINYTTLIVIALYLTSEAARRLVDPPGIDGLIVIAVAGVALTVDLATALLTYRMSRQSMNIRAAFLHNLADALGSVAVMVAGTLVLLYDWRLVDPLATFAIAGYILWHAMVEIRPVIRLLMLGSPAGIDNDAVRRMLEADRDVEGVHHVHLWQIDEERVSLEAHIAVAGDRIAHAPDILNRLKAALAAEFGIAHSTLQIEPAEATCPDRRGAGESLQRRSGGGGSAA